MKENEKSQSPMKGQFPDKTKIMCRDCIHRDKTVVSIGGKEIPVGITKSFCEMYQAPPDSNGKPSSVLFENSQCDFYEKG